MKQFKKMLVPIFLILITLTSCNTIKEDITIKKISKENKNTIEISDGNYYKISLKEKSNISIYTAKPSIHNVSYEKQDKITSLENIKELYIKYKYNKNTPILLEIKNENIRYFVIKDGLLEETFFDVKNLNNSSMIEFIEKNTYKIDLNNDGIEEEIYYELNENEVGKLLINNNDLSFEIEGLSNINNTFFISNLNSNDNYYEIIFSNKETFLVFRYENEGLLRMNRYTQGQPGVTMYLENGKIKSIKDINILNNCKINITYKIEEGVLQEEKPKFGYYTYEDKNIKALKEVIVYKEMSTDAEQFTIELNSNLITNKTDGKEWINITKDNEEYWFKIDTENNNFIETFALIKE